MVAPRAAPPDPARVVVVIPTLDEADHIEAVLAQLLGEEPDLRAVVADGGSRDGTQALVERARARFPGLVLVRNPGRTQAAALNMVARDAGLCAGAEVLVRCDAHAGYPPGYARALARTLADRGADAVVVPMDAVAAPDACFQRGLTWVADTKLGAGGSPHRGGTRSGWVEHGHHAAIRLDAFRALGGYDTAFRANEDAELDRRLTDGGGRIWLAADLRITYHPRRGPRALWRQYRRYGAGRAQTCLKHRMAPRARQAIPAAHVAAAAAGLVALPVTPWGLAWPALHLMLVTAVGARTAWRHRSACGLAAAPALWIMHTAWGLGFLARLAQGAARGAWPAGRIRRRAA